MNSSESSPLVAGMLVAGYQVEQVLGVGAMGAVVAATHLESGARVALKCLLPKLATDARLVLRFLREARVGSRLRSEHAVRVLGSGTLALARPGGLPNEGALDLPYLVMERLTGVDLHALLAQRGRLGAGEAAEYVGQACGALAEAHGLGIVHRDLKPSNLFLTRRRDGRALVKVLDFGIARCTSGSAAGDNVRITDIGTMLGSPSYMAPEQLLNSGEVDARADVWSLGVTLYRMTTGAPPFEGKAPIDLAVQVIEAAPRPMGARCPDLPPGFEAVVLRCLEKRARDRYPNVVELTRALARFVGAGHPAEIPPPPTPRRTADEPTLPLGTRRCA